MSIIKSFTELSLWDRKRLQVGDSIGCDWCGKTGKWDSEYLSGGIAQSEYTLEDDLGTYMYVCDTCELERAGLHDIALDDGDANNE